MDGQVLGGRYQLGEVLGVGGMSTVWRAHDTVLGRDVAVKLLSGRHASDTVSRQRIRVEARAAAALSHPNVAQVHDFGETIHDGRRTPYVVMELVPGPTLEERAAARSLRPVAVFRVCAEVAAGLAAAHADGVVHRDVKPANVIMAPTGAKVVDFGIAAAVDSGGMELDEELLGTPDYVAPERITGDVVTPASDVYSLGVLLYKLLTGHLPWAADGATDLIDAHLYTEPAPLPAIPGVPGEVVELCRRCLRKDPAGRPTAAEVAAALTEAAAAPAADAVPAAAAPGTGAGSARSRAALVTSTRRRSRLVVGLFGATAAAVLAWVLIPTPEQPPAADAHSATETGSAPAAAATRPGSASTPAARTAQPSASAAAAPVAGSAGPSNPAGAPTGATPALPPQQPPSTGASATTGPSPAAQVKTFTSTGGMIRAACSASGLAEVLSWTAETPYRVDRVNAGPAAAATVAFARGNQVIDMTVTCTSSGPVVATSTHTK
jgi:eukaryotic-like serine/threonine-protein kinase